MQQNREEKYQSPVRAIYTGITDLFKKNERAGILTESDRLDGKRILITGSSSGLGLATAIGLAKRGAEVVMAVRSGIPEKGELVKKKSGSANVHMLHVDLSDVESITALSILSNQNTAMPMSLSAMQRLWRRKAGKPRRGSIRCSW